MADVATCTLAINSSHPRSSRTSAAVNSRSRLPNDNKLRSLHSTLCSSHHSAGIRRSLVALYPKVNLQDMYTGKPVRDDREGYHLDHIVELQVSTSFTSTVRSDRFV